MKDEIRSYLVESRIPFFEKGNEFLIDGDLDIKIKVHKDEIEFLDLLGYCNFWSFEEFKEFFDEFKHHYAE